MYVEYFKTFKNVVSVVVTGAYFKVHSYFARVSDFQLQSNFLMAAQKYKPLQSQHNNAVIETTTPPLGIVASLWHLHFSCLPL